MEKIPLLGEQYAYILHDKDCDDNGELKKAHWHIVFYFENARVISGVGKWLGLPESDYHLIQVSNFKSDTLLYLIHNDPRGNAL